MTLAKSKKKVTSEVQEEEVKNQSTSEVEADKLTLNEYLSSVAVHEGLVASFKVEASRNEDLLKPKKMDEWGAVFLQQSRRNYK